MNPRGTPQNLVAAHPANRSAERHGLYGRPEISEEVRELAAELAALAPHVVESDTPAVIECARLVLLAARIDAALGDGRVERSGKLRQLVAERRLLSGQLAEWFQLLGFTLDARATWTARLTRPSVGEEISRRLAEIEAKEANGAGLG